MKVTGLLMGLLLVSQSMFSQKVVENPKVEFSTASGLKIAKVELTDSSTICHFEYSGHPGDGFSIPKQSYILPDDSEERLFVTKAENVSISKPEKIPSTGKAIYTLHFPKINTLTTKLDFGEGNKGGNWFIYGIQLVELPYAGIIPEKLVGYWFASDGSKELVVALFDTLAVYKSQVWNYASVNPLEKQLKIELANKTGKQNLALIIVDQETILLGTSTSNQVKLRNSPVEVAGYTNPADKPYSSNVLSTNGQASYKGFIKNFNTKYISQKTGQIHVNNTLTGEQTTHTVKIENDGSFSLTFPVAHPVQIYANMPMVYEVIFVEPGKEIFHIIAPGDAERSYFMGEMAAVNSSFMSVKNIRYFDYQKIQDSILSLTPEQFRDFCFQTRDRELNDLKAYAASHYISPKVMQIKQKDMNYRALSNAMEYKRIYERAYRAKNNIPREQRDVKIDYPIIDTAYYHSIITNDLLNDPLAPISNDYGSYINRVKFHDILREKTYHINKLSNIEKLATQAGIKLTDEEAFLIEKGKHLDEDTTYMTKIFAISEKHRLVISAFQNKNREALNDLHKHETFVYYHDVVDSLVARGIEVTPEEKAVFEEYKSIMQREQVFEKMLASKEFYKIHGEALQTMRTKYNYLIAEEREMQRANSRETMLKEIFNVEKGLGTDIMASQDLCRSIVAEASPLEADELKRRVAHFSTPFFPEYIAAQNEMVKTRIAANKLKTGYTVHTTPNIEAEQLFDAMMEKYKGKVVFVDFWATWCGPCRSGNERIKPLKEELEGKDIVFVYITGPSSPEGTWSNMIPDIKGEHYRVSTDEWNNLCGKFNVSGIPHYLLVDKEGVVAKNNGMPTYDLNSLKKLFEEYMSK